jgi:hypothetical protein
MRMKMKPIAAVVLTALAGCGGGGGSGPQGETATAQVSSAAMTACVDANQNWQCDEGDASVAVSSSGETGLAVAANRHVLLETRDGQNRRLSVLVSEAGSSMVNGLSTLRTFLKASGRSTAQVATTEALVSNAALELGFRQALMSHPVALAALDVYSRAVADQGTATPTLAAYAPSVGSLSTDVTWASTESTSTVRQLTARSSQVLNNSESNRLYLFDAAASAVSSTEIDLVPPPSVALASAAPWLRRMVGVLDKLTNLVVDTASAATAFVGTPSEGSPVALAPGKGVAGIQFVREGTEAIVLFNMLAGGFTQDSCLSTTQGNEGLFRVSLTGAASVRTLKDAPACVHSGFSLVAADAAGARVAAWDASGGRLWLLDGSSMQAFARLDLMLPTDAPPQALAVSPGGRYLAVVSYGRATLVNLATGRVITQLAGAWGNVTQAAFTAGGHQLLIAAGQSVHSVSLDSGMQRITSTSTTVSTTNEPVRALSATDTGDSYVVSTDAQVQWRAAHDHRVLASKDLPSGLVVQQTALAGKKLVLLSRGGQDGEFKLMRLPLGLPDAPQAAVAN